MRRPRGTRPDHVYKEAPALARTAEALQNAAVFEKTPKGPQDSAYEETPAITQATKALQNAPAPKLAWRHCEENAAAVAQANKALQNAAISEGVLDTQGTLKGGRPHRHRQATRYKTPLFYKPAKLHNADVLQTTRATKRRCF